MMLEPGSPAAGGIYFLGNISIEDDNDDSIKRADDAFGSDVRMTVANKDDSGMSSEVQKG